MTAWTLREFLDRHNLSAYRLVQEVAARKVAASTVYAIARGETKQVELKTIDALLTALEGLTGAPVTVCDLLAHRRADT